MRILSVNRQESLFSGDAFTVVKAQFKNSADQVAFLRRMVTQYAGHQAIRELALDIVFRQYQIDPKKKIAQAVALADWCQKNIRYVNEGPETFQTPIRTLKTGAGDCDDFVTLECALLESLGIDNQIVAMEIDGQWSHIFARAVFPDPKSPNGIFVLPIDCTLNTPVSQLMDPIQMSLAKGRKVRTIAL